MPLVTNADRLTDPATVVRVIGLVVIPGLLRTALALPIPTLAVVAGGSLWKCACPECARETFAAFAFAGVAKNPVWCVELWTKKPL